MVHPSIKPKHLFFTVFVIAFLAACHTFYKATTVNTGSNANTAGSIDSLKLQSRYFVLRNGNNAYYMNNIVLSGDQKTLECTLDTLPPSHKLHLVNGRHGRMQYKRSDSSDRQVLNEVHLYITQDNTATLGHYTLPLDKVQKIEVLEYDKKRTTNSYVIGAVGFTLGAVLVSTVIILATKSSCPFVSAYDGNEFTLQGEIYGGAIYPQLARYDFLPLKMATTDDGSLQLKISNELKERQYTDMAELWVINHNKNSKVLADEAGNLYSIAQPQVSISARLNNKKEVSAALKKRDDYSVLYMDDTTTADAHNEVVMQFKKPAGATKGKLVLDLKNSYWLDLLYGELAKGFGRYYETYLKKQRNKPASELLKWTQEQQIPLEVSVKTTEGWKKVTSITTTGPLAAREIVVPIDVSKSGGPFSEIKLSSGFMFWEIDYAAMDYSADEPFTVQKLSPILATDELGKNVLELLQREDGHYLEQPLIGNIVTLTYKTSSAEKEKTQTYILKTKGYYEHIRDFKTRPNITFLRQFTKPNAFPIYGRALYKKISETNFKALAIAK